MSFHPDWFGRPPVRSTMNQEKSDWEIARERVLDELDLAICDRSGKRFKERDIRTAKKTVERL